VSLLSGPAILAACERGDIVIDPLVKERIQPASVDLTLGALCAKYDAPSQFGYLDAAQKNEVQLQVLLTDGMIFLPGMGYLLHTAERVGSRKYVPVLDGKSSLGRLFVQIHMTAGFGDPGYFGQWTLEVVVTYPVRLYPGMPIAQMRFHEVVGEVKLYEGNYQGEDAEGPVASRSWRQVEKDKPR
jgi:dCTP deaminase